MPPTEPELLLLRRWLDCWRMLTDLDAFFLEHQLCGEVDAGHLVRLRRWC